MSVWLRLGLPDSRLWGLLPQVRHAPTGLPCSCRAAGWAQRPSLLWLLGSRGVCFRVCSLLVLCPSSGQAGRPGDPTLLPRGIEGGGAGSSCPAQGGRPLAVGTEVQLRQRSVETWFDLGREKSGPLMRDAFSARLVRGRLPLVFLSLWKHRTALPPPGRARRLPCGGRLADTGRASPRSGARPRAPTRGRSGEGRLRAGRARPLTERGWAWG